ncbi:MAG: DUF192 domain-containing protein [Boseongicola sp.]
MIRAQLSVLLVAFFVPCVTYAECSSQRADIRGEWGQARFTVDVADDPEERSIGLMHREHLSAGAGMLFAYDGPQRVIFWMKNTLIPLDMIFLDAAGLVTRIHENAVPHDQTLIEGGERVMFVLEINGGLARRLGIAEGSELRHPVIGSSAAWPCIN